MKIREIEGNLLVSRAGLALGTQLENAQITDSTEPAKLIEGAEASEAQLFGTSVVREIQVCLVPLTRGYSALVDEADYERVSALKWQVSLRDGRAYAKAHVPGSGKHGKIFLMHRFLKGITDPRIKVDHKDGDGLHNWQDNLRAANNRQNISNQKKHKDCKNKFKGVTRRPDGTWRAQIMAQYKKKNLGNFPTEEAAAHGYDEAARRLHGEFAYLNFPEVA